MEVITIIRVADSEFRWTRTNEEGDVVFESEGFEDHHLAHEAIRDEHGEVHVLRVDARETTA